MLAICTSQASMHTPHALIRALLQTVKPRFYSFLSRRAFFLWRTRLICIGSCKAFFVDPIDRNNGGRVFFFG